MSNLSIALENLQYPPTELPRMEKNERHLILENGDDLLTFCEWMKAQDYYLCTLVATDERLLEDNVFKLYYVFSSPDQLLRVIEYPLSDPDHPSEYPSIRDAFPSVAPIEREIYDLLGLSPLSLPLDEANGLILHTPYPADLYPLRRTRPMKKVLERLQNGTPRQPLRQPRLPEGMFIVPVGPIHAGVIEPGHFPFHVAGEVVEKLPVRLGYKHRGIEKLFESHYTLENGWQLAEKVSGDSSFAHSLAFCQGVERLVGVKPPLGARYWRMLFLELERLYNHIADVGALIHDMAFDLIASQIAVHREGIVQLNSRLTGSRLLCGVNRPGGVVFEANNSIDDVIETVSGITEEFLALSKLVLEMPACRDRALTTGVLTREEARKYGATGLPARASGWASHDFRLRHPEDVYDETIRALIQGTLSLSRDAENLRRVPIFQDELQGDVYARMALRVAEVETSIRLIEHFAAQIKNTVETELITPFHDALRKTPNFDFGLGYVEGWRGEVFYWVMKGPGNSIFRCKVRDPSLFNWFVFPHTVVRKPKNGKNNGHWENILADFPLINKSFNLSYAGHDL